MKLEQSQIQAMGNQIAELLAMADHSQRGDMLKYAAIALADRSQYATAAFIGATADHYGISPDFPKGL